MNNPGLYKYEFKSGWRKVTTHARSLEAAKDKARDELDRRMEKTGFDPPVAHSLYCTRTDDPELLKDRQ